MPSYPPITTGFLLHIHNLPSLQPARVASAPSVDPLLLEENPNGDENDENNAEQETDPKEKRKRAPNYQEHEDIQLCCSWIEISEDPTVGTD
ncbi:hypothetical protein PGTUg99_028602 [Puccinia graminis f. sp. tritici]|uniref:Uncharacterized protein n=1 Tax=Puccinia graminis f. sp. tritici TaxID=56615 RepID=A0A5B0MG12_PUCGR|nr:hypothetical protein PGTUg99_028602 [Puccinia graminis f. sp. tritici]